MTTCTSIDCPYCGSTKSTFQLMAESNSRAAENLWYALGECGNCKKQVLFNFQHKHSGPGQGPIHAGAANPLDKTYLLRFTSPKAEAPRVPREIPATVVRPLVEAEKAFKMELFSAAGSCYRKSIERALLAVDPNLSGMLNKRIRELEESGLLPHSMIELLDQVRLFGNASMHDDDEDPTKDDCSAAREFCHLFFTYAFTLPAKVADAKAKAASEEVQY